MASLRNSLVLVALLASSVHSSLDKPLPAIARRQDDPGITSCQPWLNIQDSCTIATTSFTNLPFSDQASCLCYSVCSWQPTVFDNAWATCIDHISTASPSFYTQLGGTTLDLTPCQKVGNVVATGTGTCGTASGLHSPPLTTGPTKTSTGPPAGTSDCRSWEAIEVSCLIETPGFTNLPASQQVSCLCYTSGKYAPTIFDGYWGSCLAYLSTASTAYYSSVGGDGEPRTPCADYGDVRATGPPATTGTSSITAVPNPTALTTFASITAIATGSAPRLMTDLSAWLLFVGPFIWLF